LHYHEYIDLPATVDPDTAHASYRNGVLEVILPKRELGKERPIRID
ncbi:MAG: Hsp20 family protein, partial [Methanosarcinaceae archaeon]|nr:Hsp20 family protein [Methanosarcinaceae archaeon]